MNKPCRQCPFRRGSAAGYLGESTGDPVDFLSQTADGELTIPCHMKVDWESEDSQEQAQDAERCLGHLIMLRNSGKLPRQHEEAKHLTGVGPDRMLVFSWPHQFIDHHKKPR